MDIHAAASFVVPLGKHRKSFLCNVALADPAYLESLVDGESAECREGTEFHEAVCVVVEQLHRNAEDDILAGKTLDASVARESTTVLAARNAQLLASAAAAEARRSVGRGTGDGGGKGSKGAKGCAMGSGALFEGI